MLSAEWPHCLGEQDSDCDTEQEIDNNNVPSSEMDYDVESRVILDRPPASRKTFICTMLTK